MRVVFHNLIVDSVNTVTAYQKMQKVMSLMGVDIRQSGFGGGLVRVH